MPNDVVSSIDIQDPLPESNWFWRRVFVFATMATTFVFLFFAIKQLSLIAYMNPRQGIGALYDLCFWMLALQFVLVLFYMVAPSAEQVFKMMQTASLLKNNVQIASRSVQDADGRTEIAQTAGKPPQPIAPPVATTEGYQPATSENPGPPATAPTQGGSGRKYWDEEAPVPPPSK